MGLQVLEYYGRMLTWGLHWPPESMGRLFHTDRLSWLPRHNGDGDITYSILPCLKGHFKEHDCFGFEAASWYWHFVDVVWVGLFIFVYVL